MTLETGLTFIDCKVGIVVVLSAKPAKSVTASAGSNVAPAEISAASESSVISQTPIDKQLTVGFVPKFPLGDIVKFALVIVVWSISSLKTKIILSPGSAFPSPSLSSIKITCSKTGLVISINPGLLTHAPSAV